MDKALYQTWDGSKWGFNDKSIGSAPPDEYGNNLKTVYDNVPGLNSSFRNAAGQSYSGTFDPTQWAVFRSPSVNSGFDNKDAFMNSLKSAGAYSDNPGGFDSWYYVPKDKASSITALKDLNPKNDQWMEMIPWAILGTAGAGLGGLLGGGSGATASLAGADASAGLLPQFGSSNMGLFDFLSDPFSAMDFLPDSGSVSDALLNGGDWSSALNNSLTKVNMTPWGQLPQSVPVTDFNAKFAELFPSSSGSFSTSPEWLQAVEPIKSAFGGVTGSLSLMDAAKAAQNIAKLTGENPNSVLSKLSTSGLLGGALGAGLGGLLGGNTNVAGYTESSTNDVTPYRDANAKLLQQTANGGFLNSNPYLDKMFADASGQVSAGVNSIFSGMNRYGSGAHQGVMADKLGSLANNIYGNNYNTERSNQLNAQGLLANMKQGTTLKQPYFNNPLSNAAGGGILGYQLGKSLFD